MDFEAIIIKLYDLSQRMFRKTSNQTKETEFTKFHQVVVTKTISYRSDFIFTGFTLDFLCEMSIYMECQIQTLRQCRIGENNKVRRGRGSLRTKQF